tara:strand:- start:445 stop:915 length:471 start_codon:yes stop_codon:yes gene_type:complete
MGPAMKWAIGLLLISAFFMGISGFIGEISNNYNLTTGEGFANISSSFSNISTSVPIQNLSNTYNSSQASAFNPQDSSSTLAGWALSWPGHIFKTFSAVFQTFWGLGSVSQDMIASTTDAVGLDDTNQGIAITTILITIGSIALIFIGLRAWTGRDV